MGCGCQKVKYIKIVCEFKVYSLLVNYFVFECELVYLMDEDVYVDKWVDDYVDEDEDELEKV